MPAAYPAGGYTRVWGDSCVAYNPMSCQVKDGHDDLADLSETERATMNEWKEKFQCKYPVRCVRLCVAALLASAAAEHRASRPNAGAAPSASGRLHVPN
jgi:hypothetical protein